MIVLPAKGMLSDFPKISQSLWWIFNNKNLKPFAETIEISSINIAETFSSFILREVRCLSPSGWKLVQGIPRPVWIVVPLMFIAATPVEANSKTLVFELSPLYDKTLFKASYKHFTKMIYHNHCFHGGIFWRVFEYFDSTRFSRRQARWETAASLLLRWFSNNSPYFWKLNENGLYFKTSRANFRFYSGGFMLLNNFFFLISLYFLLNEGWNYGFFYFSEFQVFFIA